jgi:hypothetical protein
MFHLAISNPFQEVGDMSEIPVSDLRPDDGCSSECKGEEFGADTFAGASKG